MRPGHEYEELGNMSVNPGNTYGRSTIQRLLRENLRTSRATLSSSLRTDPRPSALPVDMQRWNKSTGDAGVFKARIVGAKNIASSSGCAVTSRARWAILAGLAVPLCCVANCELDAVGEYNAPRTRATTRTRIVAGLNIPAWWLISHA